MEIQDKKEQINYVTVIPVEFRNRSYSSSINKGGNTDYIVEQYGEYPSRGTHEDYMQPEELTVTQGAALYSVSQRVLNVNSNYSTSNSTNNSGYGDDEAGYSGVQDWDTKKVIDEGKDDNNSGDGTDKQTNDTNTTTAASVPSSVTSIAPTTSTLLEQLQGPIIPTSIYLHNRTALMMEIEDTPSASCDLLCQAIINCDELGLNKQLASQLFTLWMVSPLLELQLNPTHKPYDIRQNWRNLVERYSYVSYRRQERDEPKIMFQRNIFFPLSLEEKIKDPKIIELLYEEARYNILEGRYPCEVMHYIILGGIQARIELGPYNPQVHSTHYFREEQSKYLPIHVRKSSTWTWLPISSKNSAEVKLLEQFKRIPTSTTNRKLIKKYLEFCWSLPFYGSAFFQGQIEQPVRGLFSLVTHQDIPVLVAINSRGVYIIDDIECCLLLGLRFEELSWEYARPSREDNPNCIPCLFIQFMVMENGARVSKILQIFSRQASLMDNLITCFVNQIKSKSNNDEIDKTFEQQVNDDSHSSIIFGANLPSLTNKLSRLTLSTFDEDGHCIGQMGSWTFSY